ncbi:MAG: hypothetical protein WCA21_15530 [Terracidiphilus sp.]
MPEDEITSANNQRLQELYEQLFQNTRYSAPPAGEENQWISGIMDREFDGVMLERIPIWTRKSSYGEWRVCAASRRNRLPAGFITRSSMAKRSEAYFE